MKEMYIENLYTSLRQGIEKVARQTDLRGRKIALFGLARPAFLTRTILSGMGYEVCAYIDNDCAKVVETNRKIKSFGSKYTNGEAADYIRAYLPSELLGEFDDSWVILIASRRYGEMANQLSQMGYAEGRNIFATFDFEEETEFTRHAAGKRRMTIGEIRRVQIDLLGKIREVCEREGLRYWLCGGTLLGAMRHKGFIPWDDDMDISMPLPDFLRLTEVLGDSEEYMLTSSQKTDPAEYGIFLGRLINRKTLMREMEWPLRRVSGVFVDIFPIIGLPADPVERKNFFAEFYELRSAMWEDFTRSGGDLGALGRSYPKQFAMQNRFDFDRSEYVGIMPTQYRENDCTTRKVYDSTIQVEFEGDRFPAPAGYQEYLDNLYGRGWDKLPPEHMRASHHQYDIYWR